MSAPFCRPISLRACRSSRQLGVRCSAASARPASASPRRQPASTWSWKACGRSRRPWPDLARQAAGLGVARVTVDGDSLLPGAPPVMRFGAAAVRLPPGAFLQASAEAEAVMTELVCEGVGGAKRIADLFAGLGTFTFALAGAAKVDAFETDDAALAALEEAIRHTPKLKPVRCVPRDLFRNPLGPKELDRYDAVVFDPPRAGAVAQAEQLAKSKVKRLVAVSCNPGTLGARSSHPGRWRLSAHPRRARRPVPVLAPYRGRRPSGALAAQQRLDEGSAPPRSPGRNGPPQTGWPLPTDRG